jgi:hypothetical protein
MRARHLALLLAALNVALLLSAFLQRQAPPAGDVLRGRALELTDQRGTVRARLDIERDGQVVLRLLDQRGTIRVKLGAGEDGSGLVLLDGRTEPGVHLRASAQGGRIRVADHAGRERIITAGDTPR